MKFIFILSIISVLWGCSNRVISNDETTYRKSIYEKVSSVKIPDKTVPLQTYDVDDFFIFTTLKVDSLTLLKFVHKNKFKKVSDTEFPPLFFGNKELNGNRPESGYRKYFFFWKGQKGKITGYILLILREICCG